MFPFARVFVIAFALAVNRDGSLWLGLNDRERE
jgi:hypothetical protein